jgi:hypothetical protein
MHLTVVNPFFNYVRGDVIIDQDDVAGALKTHPQHVVQHYDHPEHFFKTDAELAEAAKPAAPVAFAGVADEPAVKPVPKGKPV